MAKVQTGYPRFVIHKYITQMAEELLARSGLVDRIGFAVTSVNAAKELGEFLGTDEFSFEERQGFAFVHAPDSPEIQARAKSFLQHTGFSVSSRQAEDFLAERGLLEVEAEETQTGDAENRVRHELTDAMGEEVLPEAILLANSGANAFYALFRTARDILATQGRTIWIQLGWLYVDTIKVLEKFMDGQDEVVAMHNVTDLSRLRRLFAERGGEIAAVVTETPTNPLFQTCDLDEIRDLCRTHGAMLVADPTMASPRNAKVAGHADVIVNSLTKYAANEGDVMLGCLAFTKHSTFREKLIAPTREHIAPPYPRDLARLAHEMRDYPELVERMNQNLMQLAAFLERHPSVKKIHWAYSEPFRANYEKLAGEGNPGCMLAFETKGPVNMFYDRVRMLKSPSFGTKFSLLCPYVYLAHYDLLQDEAGLAKVTEAGLVPELIRVSVGIEDPEEIIAVFNEALAGT